MRTMRRERAGRLGMGARSAAWTTVAVAGLALLAAPGGAEGQGWIEPLPGVGGAAVERVGSDVSVSIRGRVAVVEVSEWFLNRGGRVAEGHYLYPLPGEAVFQGFSLFQGETELRGEIMDAEQARAIYEEIVRRRADPALVEFAGEGLVRARVFPIEPGQERKVTLRYTQLLGRAGGALQFVYAAGIRQAVPTQPVPEQPILRLPGERDDRPGDHRFRVEVEDGNAFLDPFSPTHPVSVERRRERMTVTLQRELQGRFALFLPLAREEVGISVATHRPVGEDGYFMLTLTPGREPGRAEPRDVTVVVDVSGSMSGEKMDQARAALHGLLGTLGREDRFRLVAFSSAVRRQRDGWSGTSRSELADARRWIDGLAADGGTNLEGALAEAFRVPATGGRLPLVVFLTDGLPSVGEQDPSRLASRAEAEAGRARVFAFGIGHDVNTHLLDRLGQAGRGSTQYVEPGEDVERALSVLAAKLSHPVLTELEIDDAPVRLTEIYPVRLPDLFAGDELVVFGRYRGEGEGAVRVRGERSGRVQRYRVEASFPRSDESNGFIPRLWAARKLGHLTRQLWTEGETEARVEEIRALALRYGIPTPWTSHLVQEPLLAVQADAAPGRSPRQALHQLAAMTVPASPGAASGSGAVRAAMEARVMREVTDLARLDDAEATLKARVASEEEGGVRMAAGRIFQLREGTWTDIDHPEDGAVLEIRAFSRAYFDVLAALEPVRRAAGEMSPVLVAGAELSIRIGEEGDETLTPAELADAVRRFRGSR